MSLFGFNSTLDMRIFKILKSLKQKRAVAAICLFIIIFLGILSHVLPVFWNYKTAQLGKEEDIYYLWIEGKRILSGENPYARILLSNMRDNEKYATYFPLFYIMSYLTQLFGLSNYQEWLDFWRCVFLLFNIGIAFAIFYIFFQKSSISLAIFSSMFWLFNRWNFYVTLVADIDFIPIFFLVSSLLLLRKKERISLVLFSISLAIKQIGVFLVPLYLIWIWQSARRKHASKKLLIAACIIISIPLLTSLPFIFWSAESLVKSVLFSATRYPESDFSALSIDTYIAPILPQCVGIKAKLPMLLLMALVYFISWQRQIGMQMASLLVMIVFVDFNSVLFNQYMCWIVPLIPLAIASSSVDTKLRSHA